MFRGAGPASHTVDWGLLLLSLAHVGGNDLADTRRIALRWIQSGRFLRESPQLLLEILQLADA